MTPDTVSPAPADAAAPASHRTSLRYATWMGTAAVLALMAGAGVRVFASAEHAKTRDNTTATNALRSVFTATGSPGETQRVLALPGTLRGDTEAALYARTNGYLKSWIKDIGDHVRKGELLAVIDAPETEQELLQAHAAREQVEARLGLAESSLARWQDLRQRDAVSQQELDERGAAVRQARADLAAANANIKRLEKLQSYQSIVAPFTGVVVRRNVEVGALIGAGNNGSARELFHLAQIDPLRVSVAVPQTYAAEVRVGQEVSLRLIEKPGVELKGKIARTAGAVDPDSRAMTVEIELPNPDGKLLPGAYVEASLTLRSAARGLVVPASALQFRQEGPRLAVVNADGRIALRPVKLGRDLGRNVEVLSGIDRLERIVLNPHDAIEAGEPVLATAAVPDKAVALKPLANAAVGAKAEGAGGRS